MKSANSNVSNGSEVLFSVFLASHKYSVFFLNGCVVVSIDLYEPLGRDDNSVNKLWSENIHYNFDIFMRAEWYR